MYTNIGLLVLYTTFDHMPNTYSPYWWLYKMAKTVKVQSVVLFCIQTKRNSNETKFHPANFPNFEYQYNKLGL